jgi:hypothetical protein
MSLKWFEMTFEVSFERLIKRVMCYTVGVYAILIFGSASGLLLYPL